MSGSSTTPVTVPASWTYHGAASVGDFMTITLDSEAYSISYTDLSNGDSRSSPILSTPMTPDTARSDRKSGWGL
jgi:hypothetical protein